MVGQTNAQLITKKFRDRLLDFRDVYSTRNLKIRIRGLTIYFFKKNIFHFSSARHREKRRGLTAKKERVPMDKQV